MLIVGKNACRWHNQLDHQPIIIQYSCRYKQLLYHFPRLFISNMSLFRCGSYGECAPVGDKDYTCICKEGYQLHTDTASNLKTCVIKNTICKLTFLFPRIQLFSSILYRGFSSKRIKTRQHPYYLINIIYVIFIRLGTIVVGDTISAVDAKSTAECPNGIVFSLI